MRFLVLFLALFVMADACSAQKASGKNASRKTRSISYRKNDLEALLRVRNLLRDESGALQWKVFEKAKCTTCKGRKKVGCVGCSAGKHKLAKKCMLCRGKKQVRCNRCAGSGARLDPLREMPCPRCDGHIRIRCATCSGIGKMNVIGGGTPSCQPCRGEGGQSCALCKGKGRIPIVDAGAKTLEVATKGQLQTTLKEVLSIREGVEKMFAKRMIVPGMPMKNRSEWDYQDDFESLCVRATKLSSVFRNEAKATVRISKDLIKRRGDGLWKLGGARRTVANEYIDAGKAMGAWAAYQEEAIRMCLKRFP